MPRSTTGKKVKRALNREYGKKKGDQVYFSMEHDHPEWRKAELREALIKSDWWVDRIKNLPEQDKEAVLNSLRSNELLYNLILAKI
jgi:hypothetical protein